MTSDQLSRPWWLRHQRLRDNLPGILILGSPLVAAGIAHSVCLVGHFLLPEVKWIVVGGAIMLRLNALLAIAGSVAGALRVGGSLLTRIAVVIAAGVFAVAAYLPTIALTFTLIPGYADKYGID